MKRPQQRSRVGEQALNYASYLNLQTLLDCQDPVSADGRNRTLVNDDEMLFITVHQVTELRIKQILFELERLIDTLEGAADGQEATLNPHHILHRIQLVQDGMVRDLQQLDTISPASFLRIREELGTASGAQSKQFREFERLAGFERAGDVVPARSFKRALYGWLETAEESPKFVLDTAMDELALEDLTFLNTRFARTLVLIEAHSSSPIYADFAAMIELALGFDERLRSWRFRHARVVERLLGSRRGTGGTSGVAYLDRTAIEAVLFREILRVRSVLTGR